MSGLYRQAPHSAAHSSPEEKMVYGVRNTRTYINVRESDPIYQRQETFSLFSKTFTTKPYNVIHL